MKIEIGCLNESFLKEKHSSVAIIYFLFFSNTFFKVDFALIMQSENSEPNKDILSTIFKNNIDEFVSHCNWKQVFSSCHRFSLPLRFEREEDEIVC